MLTLYAQNVAPKVKRSDMLLSSVVTLGSWWGKKRVSDIRGAACREYAHWRMSQRLALAKHSTRTISAGTVRRELEMLRAAIGHYHKEIGLDAVPAVTLPQKAMARERWLSRSEVAAFLWAARNEPKAQHLCRFILVGVYTGTRHDAMLRLGWSPNTVGGWIDVDRGLIYRRADGVRETKKRQPPARLPNRLLAHARRWRRMDIERGHNLVISYGGERILKIRRSWATARAAAGLGAEVIPHSLRHTAATWMMQAGVEIWQAAGVLGMTAKLLETTYGHQHPDFQRGIADAF